MAAPLSRGQGVGWRVGTLPQAKPGFTPLEETVAAVQGG